MTARARTARARTAAPRLARAQPLSLLDPPPAPTRAPPSWAVEAATKAPPPVLGRDFATDCERVQRGEHLVIRERTANGFGFIYRAFERATAFFYGETLEELTWGRIDTRRPVKTFHPVNDYSAAIAWRMSCEAEACAVIRDLCLEARRAEGEHAAQSGVYDGPGYILVITDPARRHQAALAARRPV